MATDTQWLVQQIRISVFPIEGKFDFKQSLWPVVEGVEKERETTDSKTGLITYEGWFNKHKLVLSVSPVKIDLVMIVTTPARIENGNPIIEHFGTLEEALSEFESLANGWLSNQSFPEINRLAFGAQIVRESKSREDSYKTVSNYLPFTLDASKMTDFKLQINLPTKSKLIKGLILNRLSKWSIAKLTPELAVIGGSNAVHTYPAINLILVELDVNTSQDHKEKLEKDVLPKLYFELVGIGVKLSEKGVKDA